MNGSGLYPFKALLDELAKGAHAGKEKASTIGWRFFYWL